MTTRTYNGIGYITLILACALIPSCKTVKTTAPQTTAAKDTDLETTKKLSRIMLDDPNNPVESPSQDVKPANTAGLITYCAKETAAAATPEEKKWRDAFSIEVMERICNKEPEVAKPRIDWWTNWNKSYHLETS